MSICGVIAEYNPFHNGHALHLQAARSQTNAAGIVCIMSGHFVQRGEPAICSKQSRAQMALTHGADIVLELPAAYATGSAERFASAAVTTLTACGIVTDLCFGSESGDLTALASAARRLADEPPDFRAELRAGLAEGRTFPAARSIAAGGAAVLQTPNDILAVEYIKAIYKQNSPLSPCAIKREGAGYHDEGIQSKLASATAIRRVLAVGGKGWQTAMPREAADLLQTELAAKCAPIVLDDFSQAFFYALATTPRAALAHRADIAEGLENRILRYAESCAVLSVLASAVKTKRYTHTRIQRALLHILLQIDAADVLADVPYIRVLGFRRESEDLLKHLCTEATLPVVTNLKNTQALPAAALRALDIERRATAVYRLAALPLRTEDSEPMVIV